MGGDGDSPDPQESVPFVNRDDGPGNTEDLTDGPSDGPDRDTDTPSSTTDTGRSRTGRRSVQRGPSSWRRARVALSHWLVRRVRRPRWATAVAASLALLALVAGAVVIINSDSGDDGDLTERPEMAWTADLPAASSQRRSRFTAAAASEDHVVVATLRTLSVLNATTGATRWSTRERPAPLTGSGRAADVALRPSFLRPAVAGGTVVVGTRAGLTAFDAGSGQRRWSDEGGARGFTTAVLDPAGDAVLATVGVESSQVVALDPQTGSRRWTAIVDAERGGVFEPVPTGDLVLTVRDPVVAAFEADTGRRRWRTQLSPKTRAPPVVSGDTAAVLDIRGGLTGLAVTTGEVRWQRQIGDRDTFPSDVRLSTAGDVILVQNQDQLAALAADGGQTLWSADLAADAQVAAAGSVVYVAGDNRLRAVEATSGERRWSTRLPAGARLEAATASQVLVAARASLRAVGADDGSVMWRTAITDPADPANPPAPVVVGSRVLATTVGGPLTALRAASGDVVWRHPPGAVPTDSGSGPDAGSPPEFTPSAGRGPPPAGQSSGTAERRTVLTRAAATGDRVMVASDDGLEGLSLATGRAAWSSGARPGPDARPTTDGQRFFVNSANAVLALSTDGEITWTFRSEGAATMLPPSVAGDRVVVATTAGELAALRAVDGSVDWQLDFGAEVVARPAVGTDVIAVRTVDGAVRTFDATSGRARWTAEPAGSATTGPALAGPAVIAAEGGDVVALDAGDGAARWRVTVAETGTLTAPTTAAGVVYVGTGGGDLVALAADDGHELWRRGVGAPLVEPATPADGAVYVVTVEGTVVALKAR